MDKEVINEELLNAAATKALEVFEARQAEVAAKAAEAAVAHAALKEEVRAEVKKEMEAEPNFKAMFTVPKLTKPGDADGEDAQTKAFMHWCKTGDTRPADHFGVQRVGDAPVEFTHGSYKAMQEGDATEGGYLVPDDFHNKIIERRDPMSIVRTSGCQIFQTSRDKINFPIENAASVKFTLTAEEAAYNDTDRVLGEVAISIYKFTRVTKVSEELMADQAANLESWLAGSFARESAMCENYYLTMGTGSSQPEGIFAGGTSDAVTCTTGAAISAANVMSLYGALKPEYRASPAAGWAMHDATSILLRKLASTSNWTFGDLYMTIDSEGQEKLINKPYFTEANIKQTSDFTDVMIFGDFWYYAFVESQGLVVTRNPYIYEPNGQVGLFARKRFGGAVLQAEAFQIMKTAE